ncbi:MAG: GTP-binding protein [bacterium]|nr:GTP-binding protein [bacterium]
MNLVNNKITTLPSDVGRWSLTIKWKDDLSTGMFLYGNPLETPPVEIVQQGNDGINAWFDSFQNAKTQAFYDTKTLSEGKILLVGDGAAGKTSLVNRIIDESFNPRENKTDGIMIRHWSPPNNPDITANIWDFGGQEIYHATHRFFLTKRSLYVIVLDARKDQKVEYWLKHVKTFGGESPVMVVINKTDQHEGHDINRRFLKEKYPNICDFYDISCKTGDGIDDFIHWLTVELEDLNMLRTQWAVPWFNIKFKLDNMRREMNVPYISKAQYDSLCAEQGIGDATSRKILVEYLNDLGVVVHHKVEGLEDHHVLDPEWVTNGVYRIINYGKVKKDGGLLQRADLELILRKEVPRETGNGAAPYCYSGKSRRFIIRLMGKFQLCFPVQGGWLLPDLLPAAQPVLEWSERNNLRFRFEYEFLPPSVLPRFMVKMHGDIVKNHCWRTGVVLQDKNLDCTALVTADTDARRLEFRLKGPGKRAYFAALFVQLRRIHDDFEKLGVKELFCMPINPDITVTYRHLLRLEMQGSHNYQPDGAKSSYSVKELLAHIKVPMQKENETEIRQIMEKVREQGDTEASLLQKIKQIFEW